MSPQEIGLLISIGNDFDGRELLPGFGRCQLSIELLSYFSRLYIDSVNSIRRYDFNGLVVGEIGRPSLSRIKLDEFPTLVEISKSLRDLSLSSGSTME